MKRRCRCPWCRRLGIALTGSGRLWRHLRYTAEFSGGMPPVCDGSGRSPDDFEAASSPPEMNGSTPVGTRVWFAEYKLPFTVRAVSADRRWVVCTRPFAAERTVLYTVVDLLEKLRGVDNYGGLDYETDEQCVAAVARFAADEAEFSHRNPPIPLRVRKVAAGSDA